MINIKPFKEKPTHCGPACLKEVAYYWGIKKSEDEMAKLCKWTEKDGTKAEDIVSAAKQLGLEGFFQDNSTIEDIRHYVNDKKIPVIVDWFCEDDGHYSIAIGIDKENIYLQDGFYGCLKTMKIGTFKRVWFDFTGEYIKSKGDIILRRMIVIHKGEL